MSGSSVNRREVIIGLDSGSTSVNVAVVDAETREVVEILPYERHHNEYETVARRILGGLVEKYDVRAVNVMGGTGEVLHRAWSSTTRVAEVEAQAAGIRALDPEVEAVIDGGGSEIKFFKIDLEGRTHDFAMNPECAAGSGNFLDVQANRLLLEIDDDSDPSRHFPTLGLDAIIRKKTVPISGRCSVFAKSDMIHQQQKAVPVASIVGGLHESMVNNIKATVVQQRLKGFTGKVSFQGGLSQNVSLRHCVATQLGIEPGHLVCHELGYATGALGAALTEVTKPFDPTDLDRRAERGTEHHAWEKLTDDYQAEKGEMRSVMYDLKPEGERLRAYVGVDIGSVSTNVVLLEEETEEIISKYYGPTMGRPIEAIKQGFREVVDDVSARLGVSPNASLEEKVAAVEGRIELAGLGTTGSGRFMTGHFLNADCIRNEITGQATGTVRLAKPLGLQIDTIFEIGGQDSKYIKLDPDGGVRDYTMNKVCAAGCGSFLEEQAEKIAISIKQEFAEIALSADRPADLGDRCTVFIESVMDNLSGFGESKENLVGGLAYSVANNYLNRVVEGRDTEGNVFFQGGTAFNRAVVLAFQKILKRPIWVTPHCEVTGAVGVACLAKDFLKEQFAEDPDYRTTFRGLLDTIIKPYESTERVCRICPNRCELQVVKVKETKTSSGGEVVTRTRQIFYGDRCDEMNLNQGRGRTKQADTYIDQRNRILFEQRLMPQKPNGKRIGIPRSMSMWGEYFPFWTCVFTELGYEVVLSGATKKTTIRDGAVISLSDFCVPVRTGHGAVLELLKMEPKPDYIFVPFLVSYQKRNEKTQSYTCNWTQGFPIMLDQAFDFASHGVKFLSPVCEFDRNDIDKQFELVDGLYDGLVDGPRGNLGPSKRRIRAALRKGMRAMLETRQKMVDLGRTVLHEHGPSSPLFLVIGRGYNACDPGLSLDIATKLERLGHRAIPMDFIPFEELPLVADQPNMYWKNGERILQAFHYASRRDWVIPVWITNYGCGPDSFIRKQVKYVMGGRPYLELELDEHSADAGVITRIEAFYDSYRNTIRYARDRAGTKSEDEKAGSKHRYEATGKDVHRKGRVMAFTYMHDAAFALAAIFRSRGFDAIVLPRTSPESLAIGKRYSSGKECVPYQTTLGEKLLFLTSDEKKYQILPDEVRSYQEGKGPRPEDVVFYDPYAQGPCRFGQYNEGYKRVYEELGIKTHILASGAHNNYADVFRNDWDALKFVVLGCDAVVGVDVLCKAKHVLRPVAKDPAEVTALYNRTVADIVAIFERPEDTWKALRAKQLDIEVLLDRAGAEFARVEIDPAREADVANVSMFGEIYVRCEQFINEFLIDKLERYGIRTFLAPLNEWVQYVNYERLWDLRTEERIRFGDTPLNPLKATGKLLHRRKQIGPHFRRRHVPRRLARFSRAFRVLSGWQDDPFTEDTIAAGTNKVPFNLKGELILSWGFAREAQHNPDMHGLVNIGPFGCMPSKLVSVLLHDEEITKPVYDANYDGSVANSRELKIETFASQVKAYARSMRESGRRGEHEAPRTKPKLKLGASRAVEVKV